MEEGEKVIELLAEQGLVKGEEWFIVVIMMCEFTLKRTLSDQFLRHIWRLSQLVLND